LIGFPTASKNFAAQRRYVARVLGLALRISKASESFANRGSVVFFIAHSVMGAPKSGRNITVGERVAGRNGAQPERSLLRKTAGVGEGLPLARHSLTQGDSALSPLTAYRSASCRAAASSNIS
jgi:hypothetical protein